MFSRPVSSGWKPVPTSSRLAIRPWMSIAPVVGRVIRVRSLSSVLLPAPLRPMIPTTSPWRISKSTSRSAQKASRSCWPSPKGCRRRCTIASRRDVERVELWAIVYFLPRPRTEMATVLDDIGEVPLLQLEDDRAEPEDQGGRRRRIGQRPQGKGPFAQQRPAEGFQQATERVNEEDPPVFLRNNQGGPCHGADVHTQLQKSRNDVANVSIRDHQRRRHQTDPQGHQQQDREPDRQQQQAQPGPDPVDGQQTEQGVTRCP